MREGSFMRGLTILGIGGVFYAYGSLGVPWEPLGYLLWLGLIVLAVLIGDGHI